MARHKRNTIALERGPKIALPAIGALIFTLALPLITLAQAPSTFEITILPAAGYALAGEPFTYTVVLTNVGDAPAQNIAIKFPIPANTTLRNTRYTNVSWYAGGVKPGQTGNFVWFTDQPVAPGETNRFQLVVDVPASMEGTLTITGYQVISVGTPQTILAAGPAVQTLVLTTPPTPTPTPTPALTPTPIPRATFTPTPKTQTVLPPKKEEQPPQLTAEPTAASSTPTIRADSKPEPASKGRWSFIILPVLGIIILIAVGIYWRLSHR